jgi:hypothetical protein
MKPFFLSSFSHHAVAVQEWVVDPALKKKVSDWVVKLFCEATSFKRTNHNATALQARAAEQGIPNINHDLAKYFITQTNKSMYYALLVKDMSFQLIILFPVW